MRVMCITDGWNYLDPVDIIAPKYGQTFKVTSTHEDKGVISYTLMGYNSNIIFEHTGFIPLTGDGIEIEEQIKLEAI